jgi:hypothetical protein
VGQIIFYLKRFITYIFVLIISSVYAQPPERDFQSWQDITFERERGDYEVQLKIQNRFGENASQHFLTYADFGLIYRLSKKWRIQADYIFIPRREIPTSSYAIRHQYFVALLFRHKQGPFIINARTLAQYQMEDDWFFVRDAFESGNWSDWVWRNKITVKYKLKNVKQLRPYAAYENNIARFVDSKLYINRNRFFIGLDYEFNLFNEIGLYYMYQQNISRNRPSEVYNLGISFVRRI